jgi:hypothetical protein
MTGGFVWSGDEPEPHVHDRMTIELPDGELRYRNMRKLGGVWGRIMSQTAHCSVCRRDVEIEDGDTAVCPVCMTPLVQQIAGREKHEARS